MVTISAVGRLVRLALAGVVVAAVGACGPFCGSGKVAIANAKIDSSFDCPDPATNFPYDIHVTIDVDNQTGSTVTIKSISEVYTNVAIHGNWTGTLGDTGTDTFSNFSPTSVKGGSKATVKFTNPVRVHRHRSILGHLWRLHVQVQRPHQRGHV